MILQSRLLVDEPEFCAITFDTVLMGERVLEALESDRLHAEDTISTDGSEDSIEAEDETVGERFRKEVLPKCLTPEFLDEITHALTACEVRLNRTGQQRKAEIALVARSLFELADPQVLMFHPLILAITAATLEKLLEQPGFSPEHGQHDFVHEVISDIRHLGTTEEDSVLGDEETDAADTHDSGVAVGPDDKTEDVFVPDVCLAELPARALYQNSDMLKTRQIIEAWDGYRLVNDTTEQVEFLQPDLKRCITLTSNRLLLQCISMTDLEVAMTEVEKQCEPDLIYLAKTLVDD
ncbi:MAG: hypothetical protein OXN17_21660 [Candidatus Poribacteria bacterium]|nr:hypothetical protein [Candidatus Poribacteria bacterium]